MRNIKETSLVGRMKNLGVGRVEIVNFKVYNISNRFAAIIAHDRNKKRKMRP